MGHATWQQLADKLVSSLQENNFSLKKLQALLGDGPNLNKTVWNKVNEVVLALPKWTKGLVDIGTCNVHVFHNAFSKTLSNFGNSVSGFVVNILLFFKLSCARKEDYKNVQGELGILTHAFLKHMMIHNGKTSFRKDYWTMAWIDTVLFRRFPSNAEVNII